MKNAYRFIPLAVSAALLLGTCAIPAGAQDAYLPGDVNLDGVCDASDLCALQDALLGRAVLSDDSAQCADLDGDGRISGADLVLMRCEIDDASENENDAQMDENATLIADLRLGFSSDFYTSSGWTNGDPFNCVWRSSNAVYENNALSLYINTDSSSLYDYSAAEYRTYNFYGYGYYETSMKPIAHTGVVSSFFTYTGPSDNNPWDEVDIEFLGYDTTKVQLNYYVGGVGGHEYMLDLGFDASEDYHTYGFDWQEDYITWYVDGEAKYTVTGTMPSTPSRIMMNVWPGIGVDGWLGAFDGEVPLCARYQWVTYNENGKESE